MKKFAQKFATSRRGIMGTSIPPPVFNEPMLDYAPGSKERIAVLAECDKFRKTTTEIPVIINGKEIKTGNVYTGTMPSDHKVKLSVTHRASEELVNSAIKGALEAQIKWAKVPMEEKVAIFLRAADLLAGKYRAKIVASTMVGQGKTMWQGEIDAAAEFIDFLRFNAHYATNLLKKQPDFHSKSVWNRLEYRPLEGFVTAIAPFNFTAIAGNLACAPAQMGNVVLLKPSPTAVLSNYVLMKVLEEAGLPPGVIQFLPCEPKDLQPAFNSPHFAGLHFTGSTPVFSSLWKQIGNNVGVYKSFPRIVGETGGKNFHMIHSSAHLETAVYNTLRSAFEYSGQKCSACSRVYVPSSIASEFKKKLVDAMKELKIGQPDDPKSFLSSVIDGKSFKKVTGYIDVAKKDKDCEVIGGNYSDKEGWFVPPTLIVTKNPKFVTMCEEIFGPVLTLFEYKDEDYNKTLQLISEADYALTGSIFAKDRQVITETMETLRDSAGNFYINDKCTGAVVGQQPFGGARRSGTNDKAGSEFMLTRWTSIRTIKENFGELNGWGYPSIDL